MRLAVIGQDLPIDEKYLEKVAEAAFSFLPETEGEIELSFIDEEKMQNLNFQYREKDYVTDVLSFTISSSPLIGQLFICYNVAVGQASESGVPVEKEIALLLVHGILHIFGFDHESEEDFAVMKAKEDEIIDTI